MELLLQSILRTLSVPAFPGSLQNLGTSPLQVPSFLWLDNPSHRAHLPCSYSTEKHVLHWQISYISSWYLSTFEPGGLSSLQEDPHFYFHPFCTATEALNSIRSYFLSPGSEFHTSRREFGWCSLSWTEGCVKRLSLQARAFSKYRAANRDLTI